VTAPESEPTARWIRVEHHLAQINVARLRHPLDHDETAEFVAALEPINELAESSDGFIWRLRDDDGQSSSFVPVEGVEDPLEIVNYSIWRDADALEQFVFKSGHAGFMRRRAEWFERGDQVSTACWWAPAGTIPSVARAYQRLVHLRANGPSSEAWPLNRPHPPPGSGAGDAD
jgi:hypothetical protein